MHMKRFTLCFVLVFSFTSHNAPAQNDAQFRNLEVYGKVWGFLKYFHPQPGKMDWDGQLLKDYDALRKGTPETLTACIDDLLKICPPLDSKQRDTSGMRFLKDCYSWMDNDRINAEQRQQLSVLLITKPDFSNAYVSRNGVGNASFKTENLYADAEFSGAMCYLSLTRYWNAINYFFPYRDIIPGGWDQAYVDLLPEFTGAKDLQEYKMAVFRMSSRIEDGHGFIAYQKLPAYPFRYGPFYAEYFEDGTFITHVFPSVNNCPLQKGDEILELEHLTTEKRWEITDSFFASSNTYYAHKADYIFRRTLRDSMDIKYRSGQDTLTCTLLTGMAMDTTTSADRKFPEKPYSSYMDSVSGQPYLYVHLGVLERKHITARFRRLVHKSPNLIIDVRNYPNWTILKLGNMLLQGKRSFASADEISTDLPGSLSRRPTQKIGGRKEYKGRLFILVDYMTMSQAEYTVMALQQHPRATTIGGQTAGADGDITSLPLPFGFAAKFSGVGIYYPDGRPTQQVGVHREYEVHQQSDIILHPENDALMEKALELLRNTAIE